MTGKQAFPPSITGKGAVHEGSVLDHAFGKGDPYTLGVEEEYQLLDGETSRPRAAHRDDARRGHAATSSRSASTPS